MKTALVTGASAGFGESISRHLITKGYQVIGVARRKEKLLNLQVELGERFFPLSLDLTDCNAIESILTVIPDRFQPIDILINNAGLALGIEPAYEAKITNWQTMIQTNITALTLLTHTILPTMVKRNFGMIINIGSIAGTYPYPGGNVYGATKAFIKQFSLNLRADLASKKVRVTNIEPGLCGETEFSLVRFNGDKNRVNALYDHVDYIKPIDIANTIGWVIEQPEHININSIELMPVAQTFSSLSVAYDKK